ncbi:MAG TPA: carboxypeptidase regulatory-like domain-containing protein [Gammaproteobacteria bacterium]|nr:carboxypeptidase regulatory-like domain-containing protein [Gammaproteobacteria bacterium]
MIAWVRLETTPPLEFYREAQSAVTADLSLRRLIGIGTLRRPLSAGSGENANTTVTLDNGDGSLTEYFSPPPLRQQARVMTLAGEAFSGTVSACVIGNQITIELEAGGPLPLSDRMPLRESTVWGSYKNKETLPLVYGRVPVRPVPYDNSSTLFVCADHACQGVDGVTVDGVDVIAYEFRNDVDDTGHAVAVIELADPLPEGADISVDVRGRMHPDTGALLINPAFVLWDLMANVVGLPVQLADLDQFRTETATLGIELSGIINDPHRSIRSQIDEICASIGAVWSAAMPGIARLYPAINSSVDEPVFGSFDQTTAVDMQAQSSQANLITVLRVLYDYEGDKPRRAVQFEAPDAILEFGYIEREMEARWLRSPRQAADLGTRLLAYKSQPVWVISWSFCGNEVPPGVYVDVIHPRSPVQGKVLVMNSEIDYSSSATIDAEAPASAPSKVVMTTISTAFEPELSSGAAVLYQGGIATFTINDDDGRPLVGARVTMDGVTTNTTDNRGVVQFEASRGAHILYVEAAGYQPLEIEVSI